ncbi:MAG: AAA family ATPase [Myxococcales bacterium]|nr:AAA family ATPase [Myxococcales bacterium]HRC56739.1 AAA family ATPase [Kofleriaceae bacterium]
MTTPPDRPRPAGKLLRLHIQGLRVIDNLELELRPMNVFIGDNGSGKSSVLEALELLRKAATLRGDAFIEELARAHGGARLFRRGPQSATARLVLGVTADLGRNLPYHYQLTLEAERGRWPQIVAEHLHYGPEPGHAKPLRVLSRQGDKASVFVQRTKSLRSVPVDGGPMLSGLGTVISEDGDDPGDAAQDINEALPRLRELLTGIRVHPPAALSPTWTRAPQESAPAIRGPATVRPARTVERGGSNLPNIYHALRNQKTGHSWPWRDVLEYLQLGLGRELRDVLIEPSPSGGEFSIALEWDGVGTLTTSELSDGQLAYLYWVAVLAFGEGSLLAFDEPDNHLHPALVGRLVDLAVRASEERPVILCTHSDRLLDALGDPLASVVLFERAQEGTRAFRPDAEQLQHWLEKYTGLGTARAEGYGSMIFTKEVEAPRSAPEEA